MDPPDSDPDPQHCLLVYIEYWCFVQVTCGQENMHCVPIVYTLFVWLFVDVFVSVLVVDCWFSTLFCQVLAVDCLSLLVIRYCWLLTVMCRLLIVDHRRRSTSLVATVVQGVTKRCCLSWPTNSALVYESNCGGMWGVAGSQPISTAVHRSPNKL